MQDLRGTNYLATKSSIFTVLRANSWAGDIELRDSGLSVTKQAMETRSDEPLVHLDTHRKAVADKRASSFQTLRCTNLHSRECPSWANYDLKMYNFRCIANALALVLLMAVSGTQCQTIDLPVATHGFEQWAGVVAKAMSFGRRNQAVSLQALRSFQSNVQAKMQEQVNYLPDVGCSLVWFLFSSQV